jgi:DNA-binding NarL/FixJ family response regulator
MNRLRILLADDHRLLLDALKSILEPHFEVVGTAIDGMQLLEFAAELLPDMVVLDIAMPRMNGLDAARKLKLATPNVKIVFMTMIEDPYLVGEAFRAGASGFVMKQAAGLELITAITQILRGGTYISSHVKEGLDKIDLREPSKRDRAPQPTPREREVLQLLAEGHAMKEVAALMNITYRTVAAHKYHLMEVLQIKTNAELFQYALKRKIISI